MSCFIYCDHVNILSPFFLQQIDMYLKIVLTYSMRSFLIISILLIILIPFMRVLCS